MGYHKGFTCEDWSLAVTSPQRFFQCRVSLLYISGDYPALAKMTGFTHSGGYCCHWCMLHEYKDMATHRINTGSFRRWLPVNSRHRASGGNFAEPERRPPPPLREHHASVAFGVQASHHSGKQKDHPVHSSGIWEWCPLSVLQNYDIINDSPGDCMHLVKFYPNHMVPLMKGKTQLAAPTLLKVKPNNKEEQEIQPNGKEEQEIQNRVQENTRRKEGNDSARRVQFLMCCYYCVLFICFYYIGHSQSTSYSRATRSGRRAIRADAWPRWHWHAG